MQESGCGLFLLHNIRQSGTKQSCVFLPNPPHNRASKCCLMRRPTRCLHPLGMANFSLVIAWGNVLTLKGSKDHKERNESGPTRQTVILQQLHEAGVAIFALQETRLRKIHTSQHPHSLLFSSQATDSRQYGILVGFSTTHGQLSEPDGSNRKVHLQKHHFAIVAMDPRFLIVRVRTPVLKCLAIAAHAPHTEVLPKCLSSC